MDVKTLVSAKTDGSQGLIKHKQVACYSLQCPPKIHDLGGLKDLLNHVSCSNSSFHALFTLVNMIAIVLQKKKKKQEEYVTIL